MRPSPAIIVLAGALLLEGCSSESAFMPVTGSDHGITLVRTRNYPWSDGWELDLVTTRMPECQRRHHLKPGDYLYTPPDGKHDAASDGGCVFLVTLPKPGQLGGLSLVHA